MDIVLIDDDATVRDNLKILLAMYAPEHKIIAEAEGVKTGLVCLRKYKPDLLLIDVEMQDGTGFDLLAQYGDLDFKVIFVTGHDRYAIKAFKFSAVDYLLKPVDPQELTSAIQKARSEVTIKEQGVSMINLLQNTNKQISDQTILLKDNDTVYLVAIKDIVRCESEANYTKFFLIDGRKLFISKSLKEYEQLFENQSFFRTHQSHLINFQHFDRYEKKDGGLIYMQDGSTLPVAVRKKEALIVALEKFY